MAEWIRQSLKASGQLCWQLLGRDGKIAVLLPH